MGLRTRELTFGGSGDGHGVKFGLRNLLCRLSRPFDAERYDRRSRCHIDMPWRLYDSGIGLSQVRAIVCLIVQPSGDYTDLARQFPTNART